MGYEYEVACIASIKDGRILLVKKRDFWIIPGGKIEPGENLGDCIIRELSEELPGCYLRDGMTFFNKFSGFTPSGKYILSWCCLGKIEGSIVPAAEISDAKWFTKDEIISASPKEFLSELTAKIFARLLLERRI